MKSLLLTLFSLVLTCSAAAAAVPAESDYAGYLFAYFTGNDNTRGEEAVRFAISDDGYNYRALNYNRPVIKSDTISQTGGVRDPHIMRGPDNNFYMVLTDMVSARGWDSNRAMVLLKSPDLLNWQHSVVNIQQKYPGQDNLLRVWAPQSIYDPEAGKVMVYWSMKHGDGPDIIYYAYANDDFTDILGEPKPLFLPADGKSCIDGDIVFKDGLYHLFYKTEGHGNGIKVATSPSLTSGKWTEQPDYKQQTKEAVEGAGVFKLIGQDKYILMYDVYIKGGYDFTESTDLRNFRPAEKPVSMNFHPRHGTVIPVTAAELKRLTDRYGDPRSEKPQTCRMAGPDGRLVLDIDNTSRSPQLSLTYDGMQLLAPSPLGLITDCGDFAHNLVMDGVTVSDDTARYTLDRIKRSHTEWPHRKAAVRFVNQDGNRMTLNILLGDNDLAYNYELDKAKVDGVTRGSVRVLSEATGFRLPDGSTAFVTPQSDPMIGWKRTKPSYEEEYMVDVPVGTPSQYGHGFTFPALFRVADNGWVLLGETGVGRDYCGSRLGDARWGCYPLEFPMPGENNGNGTIEPAFALPGATPWRTVTAGADLRPIVETGITWHPVEPIYTAGADYQPGKGTWSWILWQDNSINEADLMKFIDLAADMGYGYTLVDCGWDKNLGREGMERLAAYGKSKGVDLIVWYSSSGYWNDIEQSPINIMNNPLKRRQEMEWLKKIGAKGIKVDFFGGDKQETMRLYDEILTDANFAGLMVIFHGCTMPRGWERMYPNYIGSEAVLASENLIFQQHFCDTEAPVATMHPFIRNTAGSMEFGGTFLNRRLNRGNDGGNRRLTTDAFELATAVLFQSPQQNFALAPNNLTDASDVCLDFMRAVPTRWDDIRYIDGYPGKYAVIARRAGDTWYVAAINGTDEPLELKADLSFMQPGQKARLISDVPGSQDARQSTVRPAKDTTLRLNPRGGAVIVGK